jgi:hypothetical protein
MVQLPRAFIAGDEMIAVEDDIPAFLEANDALVAFCLVHLLFHPLDHSDPSFMII